MTPAGAGEAIARAITDLGAALACVPGTVAAGYLEAAIDEAQTALSLMTDGHNTEGK